MIKNYYSPDSVGGGDPIHKTLPETTLIKVRAPSDDTADVRDILSGLVAKGNNLHPDDKAAMLGRLNVLVGGDKARKIMDHVYIFNSRPDMLKAGQEDKLRAFYSMGSQDPDVNAVIAKSKQLGYGPVAGFNTSSSTLNQALTGAIPNTATAAVNPEVTKKIMLKIKK